MRERLLITCPDSPGIVAGVCSFLTDHQANILDLDQHSEPEAGEFAMRVAYEAPGSLEGVPGLDALVGRWGLSCRFAREHARPRVAILCSREDHCLMDLLWRFQNDELPGRPVLVASTVPDHEAKVAAFSLPYHVVEGGDEDEMLGILAGQADLIVLARYMRILSGDFLRRVEVPLINIHHSFLPSFPGAGPYRQAHERGVKLIGATAHYVVEELDAGPIIEQDVARVSHRQGPDDLKRLGRDVERVTLARAVAAHLEDRVVVWDRRTVVF